MALLPILLLGAFLILQPHRSAASGNCDHPSQDSVVTQDGDTLQTIAAAYFGASSCAQVLADENGLSASAALYAGEALTLAPESALSPTDTANHFDWGVIGGPTPSTPTPTPSPSRPAPAFVTIPPYAPQPQNAPPPSSGFIWPVVGPITQPFGVPELGVGTPHTGIDIGQPIGSPVKAAADGRVTFAGGDPCCGLGYWVEINHGNRYVTRYGHFMRPPIVLAGDYVRQGQVIGFSGSTGFSTGPHVHFEIRLDGVPIDPLRLLPPMP